MSFQLKVPQQENAKEQVEFRALILNRCQKEFEKDRDDENEFALKQKAIEAAETVSVESHQLKKWINLF